MCAEWAGAEKAVGNWRCSIRLLWPDAISTALRGLRRKRHRRRDAITPPRRHHRNGDHEGEVEAQQDPFDPRKCLGRDVLPAVDQVGVAASLAAAHGGGEGGRAGQPEAPSGVSPPLSIGFNRAPTRIWPRTATRRGTRTRTGMGWKLTLRTCQWEEGHSRHKHVDEVGEHARHDARGGPEEEDHVQARHEDGPPAAEEEELCAVAERVIFPFVCAGVSGDSGGVAGGGHGISRQE